MGPDPIYDGFWFAFGACIGVNVFLVTYVVLKKLLKLLERDDR